MDSTRIAELQKQLQDIQEELQRLTMKSPALELPWGAPGSDDPRWEPAMGTNDVIYTPAGQPKRISFQLFQMFRTNVFEIVGRAPLIEPPLYTLQSFVQNLFRNCEGRLLGVLTPVSSVIDYPALYRKGEVAMVAGVWV